MLTRMINFLMIYALLVTSAFSQTQNMKQKSLHNIFDKLNYNLQVLWDQKDKSFYKRTIMDFKNSLQTEKNNGLTSKDLMKFIESKIVDKNAREEFQRISTQFYDNISIEEVQEILVEYRSSMTSSGANWLGVNGNRRGTGLIVTFILLVLIGVGIWLLVDDDDDDHVYYNDDNLDHRFHNNVILHQI